MQKQHYSPIGEKNKSAEDFIKIADKFADQIEPKDHDSSFALALKASGEISKWETLEVQKMREDYEKIFKVIEDLESELAAMRYFLKTTGNAEPARPTVKLNSFILAGLMAMLEERAKTLRVNYINAMVDNLLAS